MKRFAVLSMDCHDPVLRYQKLRLREILSKPSEYSTACYELALFLRKAYSGFPKHLQSLIFQDTLFAFSLLPEMQSEMAFSAANSLLQNAESVLPKQKRGLAVTEYKHAVVERKRKSKANQEGEEEGFSLIPPEILLHIFSFLDMKSLVYASAVCRSWKDAARDDHLWKSLYATFFCNSGKVRRFYRPRNNVSISLDGIGVEFGNDWRRAFTKAFRRTPYLFESRRGLCFNCRSIVWLSNNRCFNELNTKDGSAHQIKNLYTKEVVSHTSAGHLVVSYPSDSESDTEDAPFSKLWAYPRHIH